MTATHLPSAGGPSPGLAWLRVSLAAVWLAAAATSAVDAGGDVGALMAQAGLQDPVVGGLARWGGVAVDLVLGGLLAWRPGRPVFALALAWTVLMTIVATLLVPGRWLDPLGSLAKNLPILAALHLLWRSPR